MPCLLPRTGVGDPLLARDRGDRWARILHLYIQRIRKKFTCHPCAVREENAHHRRSGPLAVVSLGQVNCGEGSRLLLFDRHE